MPIFKYWVQSDPGSGLPLIDAITLLRPQRFTRQKEILDIRDRPVAMLAQVPMLYVSYAIDRLRQGTRLDENARHRALKKAGELFASATLCGLSAADYITQVVAVTGLPLAVVENAAAKVGRATATALADALLGLPRGVPQQQETATLHAGCAQSVQRGDVLAVIAPGNGPGVHGLWPQAVALGYRVALRPSEREPWTAQRLVSAMVEAGLGEYAALLPCDHDTVDTLVDAADLSLIYGGDTLTARFAGRNDILVQGPGCSKMVIGADYPREMALELVFESVLGLGGVACVCASSVLVEGDAAAFARAFCDYAAIRLREEAQRERWLVRLSSQRFHCWCEWVAQHDQALVQPPQIFSTPDGARLVTPLVMLASSPADPRMQLELPTAAVTFAPFSTAEDLAALSPALVVSVASGNPLWIARIRDIPAIRNLYIGQVPTIWMQTHVPHDGYLAEFLMTTRGYRVS